MFYKKDIFKPYSFVLFFILYVLLCSRIFIFNFSWLNIDDKLSNSDNSLLLTGNFLSET